MRLDRLALTSLLALQVSCNEGFDLVIERLTVPASVAPGQSFPSQTRICNRGEAPSDLAAIEFRVRPLSPPGPEVHLDTRFVPSLDPGQCHSETRVLYAPSGLPDGSHRLVGSLTPGGHQASSVPFGIGWLPNLVVEQLEAPPSSEPFGSLEMNGLVCNRGTDWAPSFSVALFLSSDAQIDGPPADEPLGELSLPGLPPDACAPFEQSAPAPSQGLYLLGAIVDPQAGVAELLEEDNARLLDLIAVGWGPDLVVASLDAPNATQNGEGFEVEGVVCNHGTVSSPPSQLSLFFSEDAAIVPPGPTEGDVPLGVLPFPSLPPGVCGTQTGETYGWSVPDEGAWTLGAYVDQPAEIEELIEANNAFAGPVMGVGYGPDLVVESIDAPPSAGWGDAFELSARVCNRGTGGAGTSQLRVFHSVDAELSPMPFGDDPEIGTAPVDWLGPGACRNTPVEANAASMLTGPVHVIAVADASAEVEELLESNNESVGPVMGVGSGPDLVVRSLVTPPSVDTNVPFGVAVEICNQGTEPSPPTLVQIYHSVDTVLTGIGGPLAGDDWLAGDLQVQALNAGACLSVEGNVMAPYVEDAYYVGAILDPWHDVEELIETNNAFVGPLMGVGSGPDLVVTSLAGPPSAFPETTLWLDFEVCNQGTAPSPPANVSFYDSEDAVIEGSAPPDPVSDRFLGNDFVPGLAAGSCHAGTAVVWLPGGELGERHLGAIVDEWDGVDELVETNNAFAGPVFGVGSGPDLVVTQVLAPPSILPGDTLALDTQVCNQGTAPSPGAELTLHLSSDGEIEGSSPPGPGPDPWLASVPVPPLGAGDCHEAVVESSYVSAEGAWYVGGIVDENGMVSELVESNNAHTGDLVGVGAAPDLVISTLVGPGESVPAGEAFWVSVTACNQGTISAAPTSLLLYHSEDLDIDPISGPPPGDLVLAEIYLPFIDAGDCYTETKSVSMPIPGAGVLAASVDEFGFVEELIETNNERIGPPLLVTGP